MNRRAFLLGTTAAVASAAMPAPRMVQFEFAEDQAFTIDLSPGALNFVRYNSPFYAMTPGGLVALPDAPPRA